MGDMDHGRPKVSGDKTGRRPKRRPEQSGSHPHKSSQHAGSAHHADGVHHSSGAHHTDGVHHTSSAPHTSGAAHHTGTADHAKGAHHTKAAHHSSGAPKLSLGEKIKRTAKLLWNSYRFETIAVSVLILSVAIAVPVIISAVKANNATTQEVNLDSYGDLFSGSDEGASTTTNSKGIRIRVDEETGEEIEDPTILAQTKAVSDGYLNNCIFLGDSRYVGLVSYAVISDEDVLAQVGIAHMSVESNTFTQNSGKQYTLRSYLQSNAKDVIYIGYGVNGMKGTDEDTYEKSYKSLIEHIMEMAPNSKIVLMSIWPVDDNGTYKGSVKNEWVDKYNEFLLALAEYEGIYYLDVNTVLKDKKGSIKPEFDGGDGLHYNSKGYQAIREYILTHPVPGVSDAGTYKVHYVAPTGQFKDMVKDAVVIPTSEPTPTPSSTSDHECSYTDHTEVLEEATCQHGGKLRKYCSCGKYIDEETSSVDHKYSDGKCKWCGKTDPSATRTETPTPTPAPTQAPTRAPDPEPSSSEPESSSSEPESSSSEPESSSEEPESSSSEPESSSEEPASPNEGSE